MEGIRIVIELKRDADGSKTLDKLYKHTALRKNFPLNFVELIKGEPKLVGIKTLLQEFMALRLEVILSRSKFFLSRAKDRLLIVEGLLIALRLLDEVIQDISSSSDIQNPQGESSLHIPSGLPKGSFLCGYHKLYRALYRNHIYKPFP